jgi:hypothetical protein
VISPVVVAVVGAVVTLRMNSGPSVYGVEVEVTVEVVYERGMLLVNATGRNGVVVVPLNPHSESNTVPNEL